MYFLGCNNAIVNEKNMELMSLMRLEDSKVNNVIDIEMLDQKIYRFTTIKRLKELMQSNELVLMNPVKWDDPFENFFLRTNAIMKDGKHVSMEGIANSWYGQCWTYNKETDASWRIYAPDKDGVRISTTIKKLFDSIWDNNDIYSNIKYFIGRVTYMTKANIENIVENVSFLDVSFGGQNDRFARLLCIKRKEFAHEKEVRLLVYDIEKIGHNGFLRLPFSFLNIIEDICIDPRLSDIDFSKQKLGFEELGCTLPITQSELYRVNLPPIRLE